MLLLKGALFALSTAAASLASSLSEKPTLPRERFAEDLTIKPLNDGKILLHFSFEQEQPNFATHDTPSSSHRHYHLFPRQIGEIAHRYSVEALHLSFTQGLWKWETWGYAPVESQGMGAELYAQVGTEEQWRGLANALSGVFCASLNFINAERTSAPKLLFNGTAARHGYLARESVCTENLTPWIKQLPCQAQSGIAALLNPHSVYKSHFHSMHVDLVPQSDGSMLYRQRLAAVVDPKILGVGEGDAWTVSQLLGRNSRGACPVAERSTVRIVQDGSRKFEVIPHSAEIEDISSGQTAMVYDIAKQDIDDIRVVDKGKGERIVPRIIAHRYATRDGGARGGVETILVNNDEDAINVKYMDVLPWYLRLYMHTLTAKTGSLEPGEKAQRDLPIENLQYTPAIDRGRPSLIEVAMELPPRSRTILRFDFDKAFVKYSEHPPDANRGFSIGAAIVEYVGKDKRDVRVYTEPFLASLPTPDFSMPYNVVTFTCTILALFFGRMFNLLTRDFAILKKKDEEKKD